MGAGSKPLRPWQVCAGDVIGSGKRVEYVFERYGELYINASDRFGIEPCVDGSIRFTNEAIQSCVCTWRSWKEFLEEGKITREEYEDKKDGLVG